MEELAHRFLVAAHQRRDLGDPFATSAGQHHLAATHLYAIRRAQTGSQGRALLVGERTDKDGRSHTSQDTPFRPTFTEIAIGSSCGGEQEAEEAKGNGHREAMQVVQPYVLESWQQKHTVHPNTQEQKSSITSVMATFSLLVGSSAQIRGGGAPAAIDLAPCDVRAVQCSSSGRLPAHITCAER